MKKVKILLSIATIMFVSIRCTEEKGLNVEPDFARISDTITVAAVVEEKKDSLRPRKYIYLTIDDAPLNGSAYIDSIISLEKVKTSLFVVGNPINGSKRFRKYYEAFRKNPYIEIYNHSYSHANNRYANYYKNPESVLADFERNQSEFDISHKIARLPGRNLWIVGERKKNCRQTGTTSAELLVENGYEVFGWDVEWNYGNDYTPKQSVDELMKEIEDICNSSMAFTSNHVVLLIHNQMFGKINDKNDLQELIVKLKESDFTFEYLLNLMKNPNPADGKSLFTPTNNPMVSYDDYTGCLTITTTGALSKDIKEEIEESFGYTFGITIWGGIKFVTR